MPHWTSFNGYSHALFHFDQEPIYENNLGKLYNEVRRTSYKKINILANSEHSDIKKEICKSYVMWDWYYFFHGFAALSWFNDAKYINDDGHIKKPFCSYNNFVTKYRSYRMALTARLIDHDAVDGDISFHGTTSDCCQELEDKNSLLSDSDRRYIEKNLLQHPRLPMIADKTTVTGSDSAHFGYDVYNFWQNSLWHVVNETVFWHTKLHLTEKIFKPIVAMRPFILVCSPGNLAYLKKYGFKTFDSWINESYDSIEDNSLRLDAIAGEIAKINKLSPRQLTDMYHDMKPVLEYNKNHFFGKFRQIITDELVDNYETILRIWNNGRVDDRYYPINPNLDSVKKLLVS